MANLWATDGGIYLGYGATGTEGKPDIEKDPLRYTDDRHICLIGPNGSGKTKRLLVPSLIDLAHWSCVVVDVKGELCAMTAEHRSRTGHIIRLNPFDVFGLGSDGFNPIASLQLNDDFPDDALELAELIVRIEGKEPHWSQAAQEWVAAIIMYVRLVIPDGHFGDVRALLGQDDEGIRTMVLSTNSFHYRRDTPNGRVDLTLDGMVETGEKTGWEEIAVKASRFGDINPENRELHSVISTALTQTRWLDSRPVRADLSRNPFDFGVMKERPVTVYLMLPARRLGTHSAWLRLMIASVVQKLMKDTRRGRAPVLLMLDEYYAIAEGDGFPVISRNMALFRGYGIKLWSVWQDLGQAEVLYQKGFESFIGNAGVLQVFAPQDVVTAEYISKRTGQTTKQVLTSGQSRNPNPGAPMGVNVTDNVNQHYIPMPLMLPQDVRNMDEGFSLVFSHVAKGTVRSFVPWPGELSRYKNIMALDPGA